jgi:hypothetical protein
MTELTAPIPDGEPSVLDYLKRESNFAARNGCHQGSSGFVARSKTHIQLAARQQESRILSFLVYCMALAFTLLGQRTFEPSESVVFQV